MMLTEKAQLKILTVASAVILFIGVLALLTGVIPSDRNDYKRGTATWGGKGYSLEYPTTFDGTLQSGLLVYQSESDKAAKPFEWSQLAEVLWGFPSKTYGNSETMLNGYLSYLQNESDFKILERSRVKVTGSRGERVRYLSRQIIGNLYSGNPEGGLIRYPDQLFIQEVYLDHDGLTTIIGLYSRKELSAQAEMQFDHMIRTFRFLD